MHYIPFIFSLTVDTVGVLSAIEKLNQTIDGQTTVDKKQDIIAVFCPLVGKRKQNNTHMHTSCKSVSFGNNCGTLTTLQLL